MRNSLCNCFSSGALVARLQRPSGHAPLEGMDMTTKHLHRSNSELNALYPPDAADGHAQINVPPNGMSRLWKVVVTAVRCPVCSSIDHKAETGKRFNSEGMLEQYRHCRSCESRFRIVIE